MSTNPIQKVFNYEGANIRTVIVDGETWFVAKDVCDVLDISKSRDAVSRIDIDERGSVVVDTPGGKQNLNAVNEAGLYTLIFHSRKPEAKNFKRWVTHEVLPTIRKHGMYMTGEVAHEAIENVEEFLSRALLIAKDKIDVLKTQLNEAKPKVLLADSITASKTSIPVGDLAKILNQNGIEIGRNRLFEWLRENGYLMKTKNSKNMPTQISMERDLFEIEETTIQYDKGLKLINKIAKITGKGQLYFVNLFRRKSNLPLIVPM